MFRLLFILSIFQSGFLQVVDFNCPESEGFFPIPDTCTGDYYTCVGSIPYPEKCPAPTIFDPIDRLCVPPSQASCVTEPTTTSTTVTDSTSTSTITTESSTINESTTTESTTISSTRSTSTPGTCPPGNPNPMCKTPDEFVAIPGYCGPDYYVCVNCSPYVQSCPNGTLFDPVYLTCVLPELATCDPIFKCPSANGRYPLSPDACSSSYYTCIGGEVYESTCPGTSIFDPEKLTCVAAGSASCKPLPVFEENF